MIRRLLCRIGIHDPGDLDPRWSIRWTCCCCGEVLDGALAARRKR